MKLVIKLSLLFLGIILSTGKMHAQSTFQETYVPGEIIVRFKSDPSIGGGSLDPTNTKFPSINRHTQKIKAKSMRQMFKPRQAKGAAFIKRQKMQDKYFSHTYVMELDKKADIKKAVNELRNDPNVIYAEPNYIVRGLFTPNDPAYASNEQWGIKKIDPEFAWDHQTGDPNIVIAVIDSGIDYDHPDLRGNIWKNLADPPGNGDEDGNGLIDDYWGWDFVNGDNDPLDDLGHGTHVAGIAAGKGNNGIGIAGVAWGCKIMNLKVLDENNNGKMDALVNAMYYAVNQGARVINMSIYLFANENPDLVEAAAQYAEENDVVIAACAGNDGKSTLTYPAAIGTVIGVAATDNQDSKANFSNYGGWVNVAAPGVLIYSTMPQYRVTFNDWGYSQNYDELSGTSMATPFVAGLAALLLSENPNLTAEEVRQHIYDGAQNLYGPGFIGAGRINVTRSYQLVNPVGTFELGVIMGSGRGFYAPGTDVPIQAAVPDWNVFTGWTGSDAIADPNIPNTTIRMPAAHITIRANYEPGLQVTLESEDAVIESPMTSGMDYVYNANTPIHYVYGPDEGQDRGAITFHFTIQTEGDYAVWMRLKRFYWSEMMFDVSVDGGPLQSIPTRGGTNYKWEMLPVRFEGESSRHVFHFTPGDHTLRFQTAQAAKYKTILDSIIVTSLINETIADPIPNVPGGVAPPTDISDVSIDVSANSAVLRWTTSPPMNHKISYWLSEGEQKETPISTDVMTIHEVRLENLEPGSVYFYSIYRSPDYNNFYQSVQKTFQTRPSYTLTVVNGSGDGEYGEQDLVTIARGRVPIGKYFQVWMSPDLQEMQVNDLFDPMDATPTFRMPAQSFTLEAVFKDDPNTAILNVVYGNGSGLKDVGSPVNISANPCPTTSPTPCPSPVPFRKWASTDVDVHLVIDNPYAREAVLTMPENDTTVTATFRASNEHLIHVVNGQIINGDDEFFLTNREVQIQANPDTAELVFDRWSITQVDPSGTPVGSIIVNPHSRSTTFSMPAADITVVANYRTVQHGGALLFEPVNYQGAENSGSLTITVSRTPDSQGPVQVQYETKEGTAKPGVDYEAIPQPIPSASPSPSPAVLSFADGELQKTITLKLIDNNIYTGNRSLELLLINPTNGATLGTPSIANITILEDDPIPTLPELTVTPDFFDPTKGEATTIGFNLTAFQTVKLEVLNTAGKSVKVFFNRPLAARAQPYTIPWDGKDTSGTVVPFGTYKIRISNPAFPDLVQPREIAIEVKENIPVITSFDLTPNVVDYQTTPTATPQILARYTLTNALDVRVVVLNPSGLEVRAFSLGVQAAGDHTVTWDLKNEANAYVAMGDYTIQLLAGGSTFNRVASITGYVPNSAPTLSLSLQEFQYGRDQNLRIDYTMAYPTDIRIEVMKMEGDQTQLVQSWTPEYKGVGSLQVLDWDMKASNGLLISAGTYQIALKTKYHTIERQLTVKDRDDITVPQPENPVSGGPNSFAKFTNKTSGTMHIKINSSTSQPYEVRIYTMRGQEVRTLTGTVPEANGYEIPWDGRNDKGEKVTSDVYLLMLKMAGKTETKKVVIVR